LQSASESAAAPVDHAHRFRAPNGVTLPSVAADLDLLLSQFRRTPGANLATIREAESALGLECPKDYVEFLMQMNGGEGFVGGSYLML
jgi:hypothetical protein